MRIATIATTTSLQANIIPFNILLFNILQTGGYNKIIDSLSAATQYDKDSFSGKITNLNNDETLTERSAKPTECIRYVSTYSDYNNHRPKSPCPVPVSINTAKDIIFNVSNIVFRKNKKFLKNCLNITSTHNKKNNRNGNFDVSDSFCFLFIITYF